MRQPEGSTAGRLPNDDQIRRAIAASWTLSLARRIEARMRTDGYDAPTIRVAIYMLAAGRQKDPPKRRTRLA